jgi:hypothetical protein
MEILAGWAAFHRRTQVVLAMLACILGCAITRPVSRAMPGRTDILKRFLQNYVKDPSYNYKGTRYVAAFVNLHSCHAQQVIVYFTDQYSCGSGGCTMLILTPRGSSYNVVTSITIAWPPIRVLATKSHGWHDIAVWVEGGGIQPGYEAKLSFNGKSYPSNPTVPPARRLKGKVPGSVVIPSTALETGKRLFP